MHVFVDAETVKRVAVTKLGVCEWGVVSQGRIGRLAEAGHGSRRAGATGLRRRDHCLPGR